MRQISCIVTVKACSVSTFKN